MKVDFGLELAPVDSSDLELLRGWRNDFSIMQWCRQSDLISDVEQEAWFRRQSTDPTIKMYKIARRVEGVRVPVGACGLTSVDMLNRRAEFSIYVGPEHQRKGYGVAGLGLLLVHAFLNLGLHQIYGETFDGNPGIAMYEALGFKKDGTRRAFYLKDGNMVDAHLYSILRQEWISRQQPSSPSSPSPSSETSSPWDGPSMPSPSPDDEILECPAEYPESTDLVC